MKYTKFKMIFSWKTIKRKVFIKPWINWICSWNDKKRILKENPGISKKELKSKIFTEYYSDEFSEEEIKKIATKF